LTSLYVIKILVESATGLRFDQPNVLVLLKSNFTLLTGCFVAKVQSNSSPYWRNWNTYFLKYRWSNVNLRHDRIIGEIRSQAAAKSHQNERNSQHWLPNRTRMAPLSAFTEHLSMICRNYYNSIFKKPPIFQPPKNLINYRVDIRYAVVIGI